MNRDEKTGKNLQKQTKMEKVLTKKESSRQIFLKNVLTRSFI
jgi:hypothetical protein